MTFNGESFVRKASQGGARSRRPASGLLAAFLCCCLSARMISFSATALSVKISATALSVKKMLLDPTRRDATIDRAKFLSVSSAAWGVLFVPQAQSSNPGTINPRYIEENLPMTYGHDKNGKPLSKGILVRRWTGDSTPFGFPMKPYDFTKDWPNEFPFRETDFLRSDSNDDAWFYEVPRLVYHMDEPAVASLTQYYRKSIASKSDILDICSSFVSHFPLEFGSSMKSISAMGMNDLELKFNSQVTEGYQTKDLNEDPKLPYPNKSFDVVTCVVSMEYLTQPVEILKEVHRVLRPGGKIIVSQSNHCFPSKTIAMVRTHADFIRFVNDTLSCGNIRIVSSSKTISMSCSAILLTSLSPFPFVRFVFYFVSLAMYTYSGWG